MPKKLKLPELTEKCLSIVKLLNNYIEDPGQKNDRKAWKGFKEIINLLEQVSSNIEIQDQYKELIKLRNALSRLRRKRNEHRIAGRDDFADKAEDHIQSNYVDSIRIIKEIQECASAKKQKVVEVQIEKVIDEVKLEKTEKKKTASAEAYNQLGFLHLDKNNLIEAKKYFQKALEIDPENYESWKQLGQTHYHLHNYKQMMTCLAKAVTINSEEPFTWLLLAIAHRELGNEKEAERCRKISLAKKQIRELLS